MFLERNKGVRGWGGVGESREKATSMILMERIYVLSFHWSQAEDSLELLHICCYHALSCVRSRNPPCKSPSSLRAMSLFGVASAMGVYVIEVEARSTKRLVLDMPAFSD